MSAWVYVKSFASWVVRCARAWIEVGHRLRELETELHELAVTRQEEDRLLQAAINAVAESNRNGRQRIHERIDESDRAQQKRIDEWALQLSGQINQVYMAVAKATADAHDR